ncbi:discoidin domain-containing receptor 2-like isoform X1 [Schistocerca cancellata]|uniref:discoidin domain-containing receptor 2-like isoform X1 n=1 Tax=Schistocerca cancellata TaxID=274614 RepID=UPI002119789D|nr:discoidin domain-containing receptor 2-like isoform X1 [Schistocerca cancellata]
MAPIVAGSLLLMLAALAHSLRLERCAEPLGMESGRISDADITASSSHDSSLVGARNARLHSETGGGAWCPRNMVTRAAEEWLQVELHSLHAVTAVRTQGRYDHGRGQEYAENYLLDYWRPGLHSWTRWKDKIGNKVLVGNGDTTTVVERRLQPPVIATRVRVVPFSEHMRTVCVRLELVGCKNTEGLLSYSVAQGARGFTDRLYDGREAAGHLSAGLGTLSDGRKAHELLSSLNPTQGDADHGWVGWRNDTPGMEGSPVEMLFEFDHVRNFSAVHLHANNQFSKDVQVFSHAKAFVSVSEQQHMSTEPVAFSYVADLLMDNPRDVTVKLHHRIGRFLRLQLYFAASWILLSEVSFDSVVVPGNFSAAEVLMEDSPQRDEVQQPQVPPTAPVAPSPAGAASGDADQLPPRQEAADSAAAAPAPAPAYIGPVIGALSAVIVLLTAAILLIVLRQRRIKAAAAAAHGAQPAASALPFNGAAASAATAPFVHGDKTVALKELQMRVNVSANGRVYGQVSLDDPEPPLLLSKAEDASLPAFHGERPAKNLYSTGAALRRYSGVPDVVSRDYAVPHVTRTPPPSHRIVFPEAPPVPPPPQQYYAATEICKPPPPTSPPPLPPPPITSHYSGDSLSVCDDGTTATEAEDEEEQQGLPAFPLDQLRVIERLGVGQYGEINLCTTSRYPEDINSDCSDYDLVAVKILRQGASESKRHDFESEAHILARLKDRNIVQLLGASLTTEPPCLVFEYSSCGDLNQFLQEHVADTSLPRTTKTLSFGCLIYMATQIASAMKYLESLKIVHRDLATRNCLVGKNYHIKVSYFGMSRSPYSADYYKLEDWAMLPIRWMAWESILLGKFTSKSDVWSFAVTLWEILTFAREQPYEDMNDSQVIENLTHFYENDGKQVLLPLPIKCPREIYDLMCECWQRNESDRPNFQEIYLFLQRKNLGYKPEMN